MAVSENMVLMQLRIQAADPFKSTPPMPGGVRGHYCPRASSQLVCLAMDD